MSMFEQVRICVSDSREDDVEDEQVYQDVKGLIDAVQVFLNYHPFMILYISYVEDDCFTGRGRGLVQAATEPPSLLPPLVSSPRHLGPL